MAETLHCPKCDATRSEGRPDCPRCGLVFELLPDGFDPLWGDLSGLAAQKVKLLADRLEQDWTDESRHMGFIDFCRQNTKLDLAIRFYRRKAKDDPDDPIAGRQVTNLEKIVQFTYLSKVEKKRDAGDAQRKRRLIMFGVVILAVAVMVVIMMSQFAKISEGMRGVAPH